MPIPPRPIRPLPGVVSEDSERGARAGEIARILVVATIVIGQLWALTVALEAYLLDRRVDAWLLAGFSIVSFLLALGLTLIPPRRGTGRTPPPTDATGRGTYRAEPVPPAGRAEE